MPRIRLVAWLILIAVKVGYSDYMLAYSVYSPAHIYTHTDSIITLKGETCRNSPFIACIYLTVGRVFLCFGEKWTNNTLSLAVKTLKRVNTTLVQKWASQIHFLLYKFIHCNETHIVWMEWISLPKTYPCPLLPPEKVFMEPRIWIS